MKYSPRGQHQLIEGVGRRLEGRLRVEPCDRRLRRIFVPWRVPGVVAAVGRCPASSDKVLRSTPAAAASRGVARCAYFFSTNVALSWIVAHRFDAFTRP